MSGIFLDSFELVERQEDLSSEVELTEPRKYKVILLNDDYTPMDFVVEVLQRYFGHSEVIAAELMLQVHYQGKAVCGIYSRDIAETKVHQVMNHARENEHPLQCTMEPE